MIMEVFEILRLSVLAFLTLHISVHFSTSFFRHLHLRELQLVLLSEAVSSMIDSGTGNFVMTASCCCITVSHSKHAVLDQATGVMTYVLLQLQSCVVLTQNLFM